MAVLVLLDTICNVAVTSYLIYGESPLKFMPSHPDLLYFVVVGLMTMLTAGNECLVAGLLEHVWHREAVARPSVCAPGA